MTVEKRLKCGYVCVYVGTQPLYKDSFAKPLEVLYTCMHILVFFPIDVELLNTAPIQREPDRGFVKTPGASQSPCGLCGTFEAHLQRRLWKDPRELEGFQKAPIKTTLRIYTHRHHTYVHFVCFLQIQEVIHEDPSGFEGLHKAHIQKGFHKPIPYSPWVRGSGGLIFQSFFQELNDMSRFSQKCNVFQPFTLQRWV